MQVETQKLGSEGNPALFSPFTLRGITFRNRIVISPMQMYLAEGGLAGDWHFQHLAKFAVGGAAAVMTEALIVDPRGRNTYGDLGIWSEEQVGPLARIAGFIEAHGAVAGAQILHTGGKAGRRRPWEGAGPLEFEAAREPAWTPVGSTSHSTTPGWHVPTKLSGGDIREIVEQFGQAARRCDRAGFSLLEVHAAHGYLIHSFLSPVNNDRDDEYGGDREGRMRFALEVAAVVRTNWPSGKPLSFRLSCVDGVDGGWDLNDSVVLAHRLKALGIDLIDCSSGGIRGSNALANLENARRPVERGYQLPYARHIKMAADIATMGVGLIVEPEQAEAAVREGVCDLVAIGREALVNPHWPLHAAKALGIDAHWNLWPRSYGFWLEQRDRTGIAG